ncbi:MAG: arylesterase [Gammaproteobacteria bacterium]|nr:arylesterase [Gammaproteobacteria bacterium]MBT8150777.1 arylesterase [Gammaproteobacteria bacterium]NND38116.1 arylesterase [Pseudomonadales bacterium]NNL10337.1 arylesterase [Pseudomonadales bacterium]
MLLVLAPCAQAQYATQANANAGNTNTAALSTGDAGKTDASTANITAKTLLVLGDSLSAGYGMPIDKSWPALLEQALKQMPSQAVNSFQVDNISISGETTDGGLARLPSALQRSGASVVLIALGGNDGLRGKSLTRIENNLDAMINIAQQAGAEVILAGIHIPPNFGPRYTQGFHAIYAKLAARHKLALLPFLLEGVATDRKLMQADGLHPTANAQPRIRDNVLATLLPVLQAH